jgi:hypothetical protein
VEVVSTIPSRRQDGPVNWGLIVVLILNCMVWVLVISLVIVGIKVL